MPFKKGVTPPGAKPFVKGESGNPDGRPRKLLTLVKDFGYTKQQAADTINNMLAMTLDELKEVYTNKDSTILEKTIANALRKSLEKGSLYSIDQLLDRTHGKATEKVNLEHEGEMVIKVEYVRKNSQAEPSA